MLSLAKVRFVLRRQSLPVDPGEAPMGGLRPGRVQWEGEASSARALYKGSQEASALNIKQLEVGNMAPRNAGRNFFFRPSLMIFAVTADKIKTTTQARRQTNYL